MTAPGLTPPDEWVELRALVDAATPGPWTVEAFPHRVDIDGSDGGWIFRSGKDEATIFERDMDPDEFAQTVADARFIAAARTAVPALLAEIARLRERSIGLRAAELAYDQARAERDAAVAERDRAVRDALTEAERRIEAARVEHTEGIGNPTGAIYRTAMDRAARIVADLRDGAR